MVQICAVRNRLAVAESQEFQIFCGALTRGRILYEVVLPTTAGQFSVRSSPDVSGQLRRSPTMHERGNEEDVAVNVCSSKAVAARRPGRTDGLLEEPRADIGVAIDSETVAANK